MIGRGVLAGATQRRPLRIERSCDDVIGFVAPRRLTGEGEAHGRCPRLSLRLVLLVLLPIQKQFHLGATACVRHLGRVFLVDATRCIIFNQLHCLASI